MLMLFALICASWASTPQWVPSGPLTGDGETPGTVRVWIEGAKRTDRVKVKPSGGRVGPVTLDPDGTATFSFVPPRVDQNQDVALEIAVRGSMKLDQTIDIPVRPSPAGFYSVRLDPPVFVQGQDQAVTIHVSGPVVSPVEANARRLLANSSTGKLSDAVSNEGAFVLQWVPDGPFEGPHTVLFGFADATHPGDIVGWAHLPVLVEGEVILDAPAGSQNLLLVGDRTYGPSQANPQGKVPFTIRRHPAEAQGNLQSTRGSERVEAVVNLPLAASPQIHVLPLPPSIMHGSGPLPIWAYAINAQGAPNSNIDLGFGGDITQPLVPQGKPGLYKGRFEAGDEAASITFGGTNITIPVHPAPPRLSLVVDPSPLPSDRREVTVVARLKDADGKAVVGSPPVFHVEGGRAGIIEDQGDGSYTAKVRRDGTTGPLTATAVPALVTSAMPPHRVVVWSDAPLLSADGQSTSMVRFAAVDQFGTPISNLPLSLSVPVGDGSIPPAAITDNRGIAEATYTAGSNQGFTMVRAEAGGVWGAAPMFQRRTTGPSRGALGVGNPADLRVQSTLDAALPRVTAQVEGQGPEIGPPSSLGIVTVPQFTTPGAAIQVTVHVYDASGLSVAGKPPVVAPSLGSVGNLEETAPGVWTGAVQLPAGQDGPLSLEASVSGVVSSITLAPLGVTGTTPQTMQPPDAGTTGSPQPSVAPAPVSEAPVSKAPRAPTARPWLRAGAGLAMVPHSYNMTSQNAEDVPGSASYNNGLLTGGFDLRALAWPKDGPWGADLRVRGFNDSLTLGGTGYDSFATHVLAAGRYRTDVNEQVHAYGLGGIHGLSGVLFRDTDAGTTEVLRVPLIGFRVGVGVAFDLEPVFVDVSLTETLAPYPVDTGFLVNTEVPFADNLAARVGFDLAYRTMTFAVGSGEAKVTDVETALTLGLSYLMF